VQLPSPAALFPIVDHNLTGRTNGRGIDGHLPSVGNEKTFRQQPFIPDQDLRRFEPCGFHDDVRSTASFPPPFATGPTRP